MVRVVYSPPPAATAAETSGLVPLTHHEILSLVAPFSQRGYQVDLAGSDRAQRQVRFKPVVHADLPAPGERATEVLLLEHPEADRFRLLRTLTDSHGLASTVDIEGEDAGRLLEQLEALPVARQLVAEQWAHIARDYQLQPMDTDGAAVNAPPMRWRPVLTRARSQVQGVVLTLNAKTGRKMPADFELLAEHDQRLRVPPDLFAVLGWEWRPMRELGKRWRGSVRIAADEPERTGDVERQLGRAVRHLAQTLQSEPAEFHRRWSGARWRVTFQRAIPMLIGVGLLGAAPLIQLLSLEQASLARMFIFHAPPLLLIGIFMMRELPVIEVPPLPRPLIGRRWIVDERKPRPLEQQVQGA